MADLLRRVLQLFTAESLLRETSAKGQIEAEAAELGADLEAAQKADKGVEELLRGRPDDWKMLARALVTEGGVNATALLGAVQLRVQMVIMTTANGSIRQKAQAEYLRELLKVVSALGGTETSREDILRKEMDGL